MFNRKLRSRSQRRVGVELEEVTMRATQIERAGRPVRRSNAVAVATVVVLGLCVLGPSNLWAEPAGLTAADFVRIPEREVDLEAAQERHDARAARSREAAQQRIFPQGAAPRASATSSAPALERKGDRNTQRSVPQE